MDNKRNHHFVTTKRNSAEDTDARSDSSVTQQTSPNEEVSTHIFKSIQTQLTQEATRAQQQLAIIELTSGELTMRAVHAPHESLRQYLKKTYQHQFHRAIKIF